MKGVIKGTAGGDKEEENEYKKRSLVGVRQYCHNTSQYDVA
jgi:hypothetical protein